MLLSLSKLTLSVATLACCLSHAALADSWTVTQEFTAGNDTTVTQSNSSGDSVQAVNSINLSSSGSTVQATSSQTATLDSHNITLKQDLATTGASQAINRMLAEIVGESAGAATQTVTSSGTIELNQTDAGNSNIQAVNLVKATTVNKLKQSIDATNATMNLIQNGNDSNNIQAGNLLEADSLSNSSGEVLQEISLNVASFSQTNGTNNLQAGNALITGATGGAIKQTFTANEITMTQSGVNGSIQSVNYVGKAL